MTGRESAAARRERTARLLARLRRAYPDTRCALDHHDPLQLLVATILSAQCTDVRVNLVTPALFARCPTAADYAAIPTAELEALIQSTGFFRNKAKSLKGLGAALVAEHGGRVPRSMAALVRLPGVGRKTANVVLGNAFGDNEGVVVDTHVDRLAHRLKLSAGRNPEAVERDLMALVPRADWTLWSHLLIDHGRKVCNARKPRCAECVLADLCPSAEVQRTGRLRTAD
ncbi:MAG: endonuclease III [Thermoanaerobaculia bacterium]